MRSIGDFSNPVEPIDDRRPFVIGLFGKKDRAKRTPERSSRLMFLRRSRILVWTLGSISPEGHEFEEVVSMFQFGQFHGVDAEVISQFGVGIDVNSPAPVGVQFGQVVHGIAEQEIIDDLITGPLPAS